MYNDILQVGNTKQFASSYSYRPSEMAPTCIVLVLIMFDYPQLSPNPRRLVLPPVDYRIHHTRTF